jgi:hypothetical protein
VGVLVSLEGEGGQQEIANIIGAIMIKILTELCIFLCFVGLAFLWHWLERKTTHNHECHEFQCHWRRHLKWLLIPLAHPAVIHGIREFMVHLVIYSGLIFGGH